MDPGSLVLSLVFIRLWVMKHGLAHREIMFYYLYSAFGRDSLSLILFSYAHVLGARGII